MSGAASGGQKLTPIKNVNAPAGQGGSLWGANGGGITPVGGGISGPAGWTPTLKANASDGESDMTTIAQPQYDAGSVAARASRAGMSLNQATGSIPGFMIPGLMLPGVQT